MFTTLEIYDIDDFRADFNNICEDCKLFIYFIENTPSEMCNTYDISISFFFNNELSIIKYVGIPSSALMQQITENFVRYEKYVFIIHSNYRYL